MRVKRLIMVAPPGYRSVVGPRLAAGYRFVLALRAELRLAAAARALVAQYALESPP